MQIPSLWKPSETLAPGLFPFRRELEDLFNRFSLADSTINIGSNGPAINVSETNDMIEVTAELPGVEMSDINVNIDRNYLVISGEKKKETEKSEGDYHVYERSFGSFYRSIMLPFTPTEDLIHANLNKGVLKVKVNKPKELSNPSKSIKVTCSP